jgi:hypothetical protein
MKLSDILSKASGIAALGFGSYAFIPALVELFQNGLAAFEGCKIASGPFFASLAAFVAAYATKSPLSKGK